MDVCDVNGAGAARDRRYSVRRVWLPALARGSFTVIGADRRPVAVVDEYLAWLTDCERSPNTVAAPAQDANNIRLIERLERDHESLGRILEGLTRSTPARPRDSTCATT